METEEFISTANIDVDVMWKNILDEIEADIDISSLSFDVWIKTLEFEDLKENTIVLSTPTASSKTMINKKYHDKILKACNKVYNAISKLEIVVKNEDDEP